jgi:hypothetical protein
MRGRARYFARGPVLAPRGPARGMADARDTAGSCSRLGPPAARRPHLRVPCMGACRHLGCGVRCGRVSRHTVEHGPAQDNCVEEGGRPTCEADVGAGLDVPQQLFRQRRYRRRAHRCVQPCMRCYEFGSFAPLRDGEVALFTTPAGSRSHT